MLYGCVLLYVALIYVRPSEIVTDWATIPFVLILSAIAAAISVFSLAAKPRRFADLPNDKFVLGFWAVISVSNLAYWVWAAYDSWLNFLPVVFCYFLIRLALQKESQLGGLIYTMVFLTAILAINGVVQYNTGFGLGDVTPQLGRIRGTGIFNDPNDLGMSFVMAIPFILTIIMHRDSMILTRIALLCQLGVILLALYYTNSRGAVVGLAAALICYTFLKTKKFVGSLVAAALLVVIVLAAPSRASQMTYEEESAQSRIQSWAEGWSMLKSSPIIGIGYGRFEEFNYLVAHNSFVQTFGELGTAGAFCFVGMFYCYFKGLRRKVARAGKWNPALIASGAGVLTCSWFLSRQYVVVLYILLALGASAAVLAAPLEEGDTSLKITGRDLATIAVLTVLAVVVVYVSIRTMAVWGGA